MLGDAITFMLLDPISVILQLTKMHFSSRDFHLELESNKTVHFPFSFKMKLQDHQNNVGFWFAVVLIHNSQLNTKWIAQNSAV